MRMPTRPLRQAAKKNDPMTAKTELVAGTESSIVVEKCQVCGSRDLQTILFLGYLPPVNQMHPIGEHPREQSAYPAEWFFCPCCKLVQLGLLVDPSLLFPAEYPYTSGSTRILRENFSELYGDCQSIIRLAQDDLVVDIGSNDGTLLSNFRSGGHRVLGIEPTQVGNLANKRGIPTLIGFLRRELVEKVKREHGPATVVTATNVFAHIPNIHEVVDDLLCLLDERGVFISESHYLLSLIETLQYDTIYHEHLRYYSLHSLRYLFEMHDLEIIHAKQIPTHGGSIRVYAARKGSHQVQPSVDTLLEKETLAGIDEKNLKEFRRRTVLSKLQLSALLNDIKRKDHRIYGVGAPSRASTLINYVGLDDGIIDCVVEIEGSLKIGRYMPGTLIPVIEESRLFEDQPEYALILSWHIADEIIPKLTSNGFEGSYIVPLPTPRVVHSAAG